MAAPTPEQVTVRLRALSEMSRIAAPRSMDYSPAAITARLRELSDLSELCRQLVEIGATARHR